MNEKELLFALLRTEVCGVPVDENVKTAFSPELLEKTYALAASHDLAHLSGQALSDLGVLRDDAISQKFRDQAMQAVYRYVRLSYEYEQVCKTLEEAGISFIPLKGSVLRAYYPEPWMRTSCDIDILVKEETLDAAVLALTQTLGYQSGAKGDHDIPLCSASGVHVELHYDTIQERYAVNDCRDVLAQIWEDAVPKGSGASHYCMTDEMFYFYHMAHMAKHFETGGCGIRPFLDVWILNHKVAHDKKKREALLREGGLLKFAQAAESVSEVWFSEAKSDEMTDAVSDYILRAGGYGNNENRAAVGQAKMGGKLRYVVLRRVFMPYDYLKAEYPILKKHKWLLPVYQVVRWFRMLFGGGVTRTLYELKSNSAVSATESASAADILNYLGL